MVELESLPGPSILGSPMGGSISGIENYTLTVVGHPSDFCMSLQVDPAQHSLVPVGS